MRSVNLPSFRRSPLRSSALALLAVLFGGATSAGAASTYFAQDLGTGVVPASFPNSTAKEAQFLALLTDPASEDFSGFDVAEKGPLAIFAGGSVTGTLSDGVPDGGSIRGVLDDAQNRGFATSGVKFWKNETTDDAGDDLFRVDFSTGVRAFGFYATAWSTESSPNMDATQLALYLVRADSSEVRIEIPHGHQDLPGSVFYFGVIDDLPFVAAALRNDSTTDPGDRIGFDDFTVAVVPEPSPMPLVLAGLLAFAAIARRGPPSRPA